ncbi:hypothetical protein QTI66_29110 [Variovorax sp. J22R133]|uniref:hypothetical protein n=1 Tax=Variovorax brevis TaxID=3053503 RepID=UPI002578BA22|nr:hypothetical protein [Variovorax sp. J22R133]MDM0116230.1 hypothetical protein [Variovorax sp. J22R133]
MDEFLDPSRHEQLWIGACAHQLQRRWRTVDPDDLEDLAASLARDPALRALSPAEAAGVWLRPIGGEDPAAR